MFSKLCCSKCGAQYDSTSLFPCSFTFSKVNSEEKEVAYILKTNDSGAGSDIFIESNSGK